MAKWFLNCPLSLFGSCLKKVDTNYDLISQVTRCFCQHILFTVLVFELFLNVSQCCPKVYSEKQTDNFCVWPFYNHFWPLFCQLHKYLSQNLDSDSHFEELNMCKSQLDQILGHKSQFFLTSVFFKNMLKFGHS